MKTKMIEIVLVLLAIILLTALVFAFARNEKAVGYREGYEAGCAVGYADGKDVGRLLETERVMEIVRAGRVYLAPPGISSEAQNCIFLFVEPNYPVFADSNEPVANEREDDWYTDQGGLAWTTEVNDANSGDIWKWFIQDREWPEMLPVGQVLDSKGKPYCGIQSEKGYKLDFTDPNCLTDDTIGRLCASGRVCAVKGHNWRDGRPGEGFDVETGIGFVYADYHPTTNYRTCRLCGKCETQELSWK